MRNDSAVKGFLILVGLIAISTAVAGFFGLPYGVMLFGVVMLIIGLLP